MGRRENLRQGSIAIEMGDEYSEKRKVLGPRRCVAHDLGSIAGSFGIEGAIGRCQSCRLQTLGQVPPSQPS